MISKKIEKVLNEQLNMEMYSSNLYLSMSAYFEANNLSGFAHWMKVQAGEEYVHAMKFYNYINNTGGRVKLEKIDMPKFEWDSILDVFEDTLNHEQSISKMINNITTSAMQENDHATVNFLGWFIDEQVEEEVQVDKIINELKLLGDNKSGIFMIDRELKQRTEVLSYNL